MKNLLLLAHLILFLSSGISLLAPRTKSKMIRTDGSQSSNWLFGVKMLPPSPPPMSLLCIQQSSCLLGETFFVFFLKADEPNSIYTGQNWKILEQKLLNNLL